MRNKPKKNGVACPKCGKVGSLTVRENGRAVLYCNCNPAGPVLDVELAVAPLEIESEEAQP